MKKLVCLFVLLLTLSGIAGICTGEQAGLQTGDGYVYALKTDGTAEITGYTGPGGKISIPGSIEGIPVTSIGNKAFSGHIELTSITIPDGVTSVDDFAFSLCISLAEINIPESVTSIGDFAFAGCGSLARLTFPEGITSIGNYAFNQCGKLTSVTVPAAADLGEGVFDPETEVNFREAAEVPDGKSTAAGIEEGISSWINNVISLFSSSENEPEPAAAEGTEKQAEPDAHWTSSEKFSFEPLSDTACRLTGFNGNDPEISIPGTGPDGCRVTEIGKGAFSWNNSLSSVIIPGSVTLIGNQAFSQCKNLTSITIPEGVTFIGDLAFSQCKALAGIILPESLTFIGENAFTGCTSLESIRIPDSVTSVSTNAFDPSTRVYRGDVAEPAPSFQSTAARQTPEVTLPASLKVGDTITFGKYEQDNDLKNGPEPIEWQVLTVDNDRALVISKYGLDGKPYHTGDYGDQTWHSSTLRNWLNWKFIQSSFSSDEREMIRKVTIQTQDNPVTKAKGGRFTNDRIFLLSYDEANRYFPSDAARQCRPTAYAAEKEIGDNSWWLRTPASEIGYKTIALVDSNGGLDPEYGGLTSYPSMVRPAFWLDLIKFAGYTPVIEEKAAAEKNAEEMNEAVGKLILFGQYEQDNNRGSSGEPIIWQVLAVKDGRALVISKMILDIMSYAAGNDNIQSFDRNITWETSPARDWLNGSFYQNAFNSEEKSRIFAVTNENPDNPDFGTKGGNPTEDRVFLLSLDEAVQYLPAKSDRKAIQTKFVETSGKEKFGNYDFWDNNNWMLRTPGMDPFVISRVNNDGTIHMTVGNGGDFPRGVRPAMWMNIDGLQLYDDLSEQENRVRNEGVRIDSCTMKSFLKPGDHAEVAISVGLKMRKEPAGEEIGVQAFSGKDIRILDGPICEGGVVWFEIDFLGYHGWAMEGKDGTYYLRKTGESSAAPAPAAASSPVPTAAPKPSGSSGQQAGPGNKSRLKIGDSVQVVNTTGLQMHFQPNGQGIADVQVFPGKNAKVTDGPKIIDGVIWWELDFLGYHGWVVEFTPPNTYYLEKNH